MRLLPLAGAALLVACDEPERTFEWDDFDRLFDDTGVPLVTDPAGLTGEIVVNGQRCAVDEGELKGFCLESENVFSNDGANTCGNTFFRATAWLSANALSHQGTFQLNTESTTPEPGMGAVWLNYGPKGAADSFTSLTGTASLQRFYSKDGDEYVTVSFDIDTVDFLTQTKPGPSARGTIVCERSSVAQQN